MNRAWCVLSLTGLASAAIGAMKPPLQMIGNPQRLTPIRLMAAEFRDGHVIPSGEWIAVDGATSGTRSTHRVAKQFDAFSSDENGLPTDSDYSCGMGSSRWYFGPSYPNPMTVDDVNFELCDYATDQFVNQIGFAWYWNYGDDPTAEYSHCYLGIFLGDATLDDSCDVSPDEWNSVGVIIDYGYIPNGGGGGPLSYCYDHVGGISDWSDETGFEFGGLCQAYGICIPIPNDRNGHSRIIIANDFDEKYLTPAASAQPMLWGTHSGQALGSKYGSRSSDLSWDDDNPMDGSHTAPDECYSYVYQCPDPLDKMICWSSTSSFDACAADVDGNNFVNGDDFDIFVDAFIAGSRCADFDFNLHVNATDFDLFIAAFENGC